MIGRRVGLLTIIAREHLDPKVGRIFRCECECGNITFIPQSNLLTGNTRSCGCLRRRKNDLPFAGASRLPEYNIWTKMIARCYDHEIPEYKRYGGRGIVVCDRWRTSFSNFLEDMGRRPSTAHTLDRRDNEGNYALSNCRWATWIEQQNNRRDNQRITYQNQSLTIPQWSRLTGIPPTTIFNRLKLGWSIDQALTRMARTRPRPNASMLQNLTFNGETLPITEWAERTGFSYRVIWTRIKSGWSTERALTIPIRPNRIIEFDGKSMTLQQWSDQTGIKFGTLRARIESGWPIADALSAVRLKNRR